MHTLLNREGLRVNHKRAQRLYSDEGLLERVKKRKRSRIGISSTPGLRYVADHLNHVWALNFQFDQTSDCQVLKYLNVTDEFTKEALAIEMKRSMSGDEIVTILESLINVHEAPEFVWMDSGTEMTRNTVAYWCRFSPAKISFIDPGSPWKNAYVEPFNGKMCDELQGIEIFATLLEAKIMAEDYRQDHNQNRPHSSLGYMTPHEFKQKWHHNNQGLTTVLGVTP